MLIIQKAEIEDAPKLLKLQKEAFAIYSQKYGDFESNPYHMSLQRMEFNIRYRYGQYYKLIQAETNEMIGGIFAFELDNPQTMKLAQFYLKSEYRSIGYGKKAFQFLLDQNPNITKWYADTILEEEYNIEFYKHFNFEIIDKEEEHQGLTFVTLLKKCNL